MLNTLFSKTRRMIALAGVGLFAANCLMADLLPFPTRKRPRPIPMKANPSSQQPVRPYIHHMDPSGQKKDPEPMTATMYGRLIYLGANATADANYALYRKDGEKMIPVCFFMWEGRGLEKYLDHDVKVTGFVKEKKGWTCPLLIFEYLENVEFLHTEESKPQPPPAVFTPVEPQPVQPPKPEAVKPLPPPQPAKPLPPPAAAQPQPTFVPASPQPAQPQPTFVPPSKPVKVQPQPVVVPPPFPNPVPKRQPQPVVVPPSFPNPSSAKPLPPPEPIMPPPATVEPPLPPPATVEPLLPPTEPVKPLPPPPATVEPLLPPSEPVKPLPQPPAAPVEPQLPPEVIKPQPKPATLELLLPPTEAVKPQPKPATIEPLLPPPEPAKPLPPPETIETLPPPDAGKTFTPRKAKPFRPLPPAKQFHR